MNRLLDAKERWEKIMDKKMTNDEFTMFNWGYTYAISDLLEIRFESKNGVKNE